MFCLKMLSCPKSSHAMIYWFVCKKKLNIFMYIIYCYAFNMFKHYSKIILLDKTVKSYRLVYGRKTNFPTINPQIQNSKQIFTVQIVWK